MYPSDIQTCNFLVESNKNYGWPKSSYVSTGKNQKDRVINIAKMLDGVLCKNLLYILLVF